jgi:hypothetical protein
MSKWMLVRQTGMGQDRGEWRAAVNRAMRQETLE